ncbi:MAG: hypothetical protein SV765_12500 [Pseudomonadota bacterium]|nr:hypothetical protein [Pseudomonadota bacterium]
MLALLLIGTRGQHFAALNLLPSASWAVFFLAGIYLRPAGQLPAWLALVWALDFVPHLLAGASLDQIITGQRAVCLTPAYGFLLAAYSALWFAGRWYARRHEFRGQTLLPLAAALLLGSLVCELLSSGSFYLLSGYFSEPNVGEFLVRLATYFPRSLLTLSFYVAIAALLHGVIATVASLSQGQSQNPNQGNTL